MFSLRTKIILSFLGLGFLSFLGAIYISYFILKKNTKELSQTDRQNKIESLLSSLDYAVSQKVVSTQDLEKTLSNKIFEIADITNQDLVIYDLKGNYLLSSRDERTVSQKKINSQTLTQILKNSQKIDIIEQDKKTGVELTSSYVLLKNNDLEPVGVVYFPYYHSDSIYKDILKNNYKYVILGNIVVVLIGGILGYFISKNVVDRIRKLSEKIEKFTLFENQNQEIKDYSRDEFFSLVQSYNKMLSRISTQKDKMTLDEREQAWQQMSRQVAHEIKNPLTPMKLYLQNFTMRFNPEDEKIKEKVKDLETNLVLQMDKIASVADSFFQYNILPKQKNERFELSHFIKERVYFLELGKVFVHSNSFEIWVDMDKNYISMILENVLRFFVSMVSSHQDLKFDIEIEKIEKNLRINIFAFAENLEVEISPEIFTPKFSSVGSGVAMGLPIVKKMVESYDGEVAFQGCPYNKGKYYFKIDFFNFVK